MLDNDNDGLCSFLTNFNVIMYCWLLPILFLIYQMSLWRDVFLVLLNIFSTYVETAYILLDPLCSQLKSVFHHILFKYIRFFMLLFYLGYVDVKLFNFLFFTNKRAFLKHKFIIELFFSSLFFKVFCICSWYWVFLV